jgi:hypothetical protein
MAPNNRPIYDATVTAAFFRGAMMREITIRRKWLAMALTAPFIIGMPQSQAQELAANSSCGPVYPYRLEGSVCRKMRQASGQDDYGGSGVHVSVPPGATPVCCVTKEFATQNDYLRRDTQAERCGGYFKDWQEASAAGNGQTSRRLYERIKSRCPAELRAVAAAANVRLDRPARAQEPATGQLGGDLYRSLAGKSSGELEGIATARRRDPSQDMTIADAMMLGVQIGSMAASMYPARSISYGRAYAPSHNAAPSRPVYVPSGPPRRSSSDITGLGR